MASGAAASARDWGAFGMTYNRANFKFDQDLRWERYTTGRKMAVAQVTMFREDVKDLATVTTCKLKVYGPIYTFVVIVCTTTFVEGRVGVGMPGPPAFIAGVYLQCLGIGMCFMVLATWLLFNAAIRAQVTCTQLRTRVVRVPVPTQRQLDSSRKLLSSFEEQNLYDMFRIPIVMPNSSGPAPAAAKQGGDSGPRLLGKEVGPGPTMYGKEGGKPKGQKGEAAPRMPERTTAGHPSWYEEEMDGYQMAPNDSPSGFGMDGPPVPYDHFELLRAAQRSWWSSEAYMRVCFLYGMMHLLLSFAYWLVIHNIAELGLIWSANVATAAITASIWIIFRLDVLPEYGGRFPIEISGPFVTAVGLALNYSKTVDQAAIDAAQAIAMIIIVMQLILTFRLYAVARPNRSRAVQPSLESGGRLFNRSAGCDHPPWLPNALQHVMYLVAPPKPFQRAAGDERHSFGAGGRMGSSLTLDSQGEEDMRTKIDMTPWYYTRTLLFVSAVGWCVLIAGHAVEIRIGERTLLTNGGMPPWTRTGAWYGWEHGPTSSKHNSHVTPQRGHWAWQGGWGPNGQQETWPSEFFSGSTESDMWWSETEGPHPQRGAAGIGKNTWAQKQAQGHHHGASGAGSGSAASGGASGSPRVPGGASGNPYYQSPPDYSGSHADDSAPYTFRGTVSGSSVTYRSGVGHHRRLLEEEEHAKMAAEGAGGSAELRPPRPLVPVPVRWPEFLEPNLLACGPDGAVAAFMPHGAGALLAADSDEDDMAASESGDWRQEAKSIALDGLAGLARSVSWGRNGLVVLTSSGKTLACPASTSGARCSPFGAPPLPGHGAGGPATVFEAAGGALRAAVAGVLGRVAVLELASDGEDEPAWRELAAVRLPEEHVEVAALSAREGHLLVVGSDGVAYKWALQDGLPADNPSREAIATSSSEWRAACLTEGGRIMHLAARWAAGKGGGGSMRQELLL